MGLSGASGLQYPPDTSRQGFGLPLHATDVAAENGFLRPSGVSSRSKFEPAACRSDPEPETRPGLGLGVRRIERNMGGRRGQNRLRGNVSAGRALSCSPAER